MKEFFIKIKTGVEKDLTIGSFSGLTWGESLDEEENDRKTFTFNVSSQNSDLLEYIKVGRVIRLESENPSFKKSFVISNIRPVEGETENEDFFEVVAEDFASFIFSRNNVGLTLDTMVDDDYIEWLDSEGLDGNAEDLVNYILVRGRLKSTDESTDEPKEGSWGIGEDSDLSDHRVNLQLSDSNTYNALIEVALLTDTIMEFDYEEKTISFYNRAENKRFDKGFQLSPYFNLADLNMTLTGETLFPILHMEGGEDDTGMVISVIPYLSYSSWERLHDNLKEEFDEQKNSGGRAAALEKMKLGEFFQSEYAKKIEDPEDPKGVLVGVRITEEEVKHIDNIPYLDSFLLSLDYYKDFIEENDNIEKANFQSFLEKIYLDLGVANSNLQSKNIRNMLIEEQVLTIERRINEAAEAVAASRENIYEDESNKLDSLFMKKGGRESAKEEFSNWISGDTIIPGSKNEERFRDIYKGRYVFQEIDYDEYQYLKALENEEGEKVYSEDWDKESPLTGEENPNLLHRAETSEGAKFYFTNSVEKLRGLKIKIFEENKNGKIEEHNVEFSDSPKVGMSSKILEGLDDEIDDFKWKHWDEEGSRQYIEKEHTVKIVDDPEKNFEDWEDFFNDEAGDKDRFEIESRGKLRIPKLISKTLPPSSTKPVLESDWESEAESIDGYTKIEMKDGFYRNLLGTKLYSGSTNSSMSYPVRMPEGFVDDFNENAQFYPLNDNITLVIEQGIRIGYVDKRDPTNFKGIMRNLDVFIPRDQIYRVFFYSNDEFSISWSWGDQSSRIGLYKCTANSVDLSEPVVELDSPIGTVTGGWYREKKLVFDVYIETGNPFSSNPFMWEPHDLWINGLGDTSPNLGYEFSEDLLEEQIRDNLTPNRTIPSDSKFKDLQDVLDDALVGVPYVIIGGTVHGPIAWPQRKYYKITVTFELEEKEKGFYFMNTDTESDRYRRIEASTWDDPTIKLKAWQFANIVFHGYRPTTESFVPGYDQILTHGDTYLFTTLDTIMSSDYIWRGWSATGSNYSPRVRLISTQDKLYLLQAYDSNTSDSGNIYFLKKDSNNKTNITRVTGEFEYSTINSPGENMIWLGGNRSLKISNQENNWVGTYQTVTGTTSKSFNDAEFITEFPKTLQMEPEIPNKWDYLPFRNTILYKGKTGTSWRIDTGHTIDLGLRITQDQVEEQVSEGKIALNTISYHWDENNKIYNAKQISWGVRDTASTIPSSELSFDFEVTQAWIEHKKDSFDMLRFETPYLDLLNVFRGQDYIRDLNYKYRREIDFYINKRKEIEEKMEGTEEEKEFYESELEAIESEIGDANGYILPDKLEGLGDFWKYRTLREYQNETGVEVPVNELVWGIPTEVAEDFCTSVNYNPIGTSCSIEGDTMMVSASDLGITGHVNVNPYYQEWKMSEEDHNIIWNDINSFNVDYPHYPYSYDKEVYVGLLDNPGGGQNFKYNSTTLHNKIKAHIMAKISSFQGSSGNGVAYVKLQTYWDDQGLFYHKGVALAVPFLWRKEPCYELTCYPRKIIKWKNYSAWLTDWDSIKFENIDQEDLIVVEFRATGSLKINDNLINNPSGFWEKRVFVSEKPFVEVSGENVQIRSIKVVDPKDEKFIDTLNNLITWKNEIIFKGDDIEEMTEPDAEEGEGVTIDHMRVFLTQSEKYTGASDESKRLGYSTIKGRLTLKQNRFEHFMWDRESRSTMAHRITYENSTHGELKDAREEREKLWFKLKQEYPEFLLEGYYTNETENDAYNLLQQAKASYKYHNKPSEEYSITYIEAQDLIGDANNVRVGDKVAIKSRMRDQLRLSDRLQVTAISRELRDPSNIQIEVSPIRRDNLLEKVFGLVKRK